MATRASNASGLIAIASKIDERVYSLDPFPFASDRLTLVSRGRYVAPFPEDFPPERVGASLWALPAERQSYELVPTSIAQPLSAQRTRRLPGCTGFGDPERMRRAFVRTFGQPPQALRRTAKIGLR